MVLRQKIKRKHVTVKMKNSRECIRERVVAKEEDLAGPRE